MIFNAINCLTTGGKAQTHLPHFLDMKSYLGKERQGTGSSPGSKNLGCLTNRIRWDGLVCASISETFPLFFHNVHDTRFRMRTKWFPSDFLLIFHQL